MSLPSASVLSTCKEKGKKKKITQKGISKLDTHNNGQLKSAKKLVGHLSLSIKGILLLEFNRNIINLKSKYDFKTPVPEMMTLEAEMNSLVYFTNTFLTGRGKKFKISENK